MLSDEMRFFRHLSCSCGATNCNSKSIYHSYHNSACHTERSSTLLRSQCSESPTLPFICTFYTEIAKHVVISPYHTYHVLSPVQINWSSPVGTTCQVPVARALRDKAVRALRTIAYHYAISLSLLYSPGHDT